MCDANIQGISNRYCELPHGPSASNIIVSNVESEKASSITCTPASKIAATCSQFLFSSLVFQDWAILSWIIAVKMAAESRRAGPG